MDLLRLTLTKGLGFNGYIIKVLNRVSLSISVKLSTTETMCRILLYP